MDRPLIYKKSKKADRHQLLAEKRVRRFACFMFICLLAPSCEPIQPRPGMGWSPARIDPKTGRVVALWVKWEKHKEPFVVTLDYGMLTIWNDQEKRFYLFDNLTKQHFITTDWSAFLREIEQLPGSVPIQRIDTCTVPRDWKEPDDKRRELARALKAGKHEIKTPFVACYCESKGIEYIGR